MPINKYKVVIFNNSNIKLELTSNEIDNDVIIGIEVLEREAPIMISKGIFFISNFKIKYIISKITPDRNNTKIILSPKNPILGRFKFKSKLEIPTNKLNKTTLPAFLIIRIDKTIKNINNNEEDTKEEISSEIRVVK